MAGTVGPLETRPKTTVATLTDLAFLDASPWGSGERAFAVSVQKTYQLRRESVAIVDGINVVPVGPNSIGQGRWIEECFLCVVSSNSAHARVLTDLSTSLTTYSLFLGPLSITTTQPVVVISSTASCSCLNTPSPGNALNFAIHVDGEAFPVQDQVFSLAPPFLATSQSGGVVIRKPVAPGVHTVSMSWKISQPGNVFVCQAITRIDQEAGNLLVIEEH